MSKEAMKLALEAINNLITSSHATDPQHWRDARQDAVTALAAIDKALAEQPAQQEPVGKIVDCDFVGNSIARFERHLPFGTLLYTSPPAQRKPWVGLTDEDVMSIVFNFDVSSLSLVAKAIEAKLKEKNT